MENSQNQHNYLEKWWMNHNPLTAVRLAFYHEFEQICFWKVPCLLYTGFPQSYFTLFLAEIEKLRKRYFKTPKNLSKKHQESDKEANPQDKQRKRKASMLKEMSAFFNSMKS